MKQALDRRRVIKPGAKGPKQMELVECRRAGIGVTANQIDVQRLQVDGRQGRNRERSGIEVLDIMAQLFDDALRKGVADRIVPASLENEPYPVTRLGAAR